MATITSKDLDTMEFVLEPGTFNGFAKTYLIGGRCPYSGKTRADFETEGFKVLSSPEFDEFIKNYELSMCDDWHEISADTFDEMLCVLPPVGWYGGGFFLQEAQYGTIHGFYQKYNGKFYTSLQRITTPREDIIKSLETYINN